MSPDIYNRQPHPLPLNSITSMKGSQVFLGLPRKCNEQEKF